MHIDCLSWVFWDPQRVLFVLPLIKWPVAFYGLFFAFGFLVGYYIFYKLLLLYVSHYSLDEKDVKDWKKYLYIGKEFKVRRVLWFLKKQNRSDVEEQYKDVILSREEKSFICCRKWKSKITLPLRQY